MGSAFAQRLKGFGVTVLAYDKYKTNFSDEYVKEATLDELFERTDVLSLHIPLAEETRFMVNAGFLEKFRKNIYVVNAARGKVLKTDDLVEAMKQGKVLGACLDVLEYESLSFEGLDKDKLPEAFQYLIKSDKAILTPHIAGWTHEVERKDCCNSCRKDFALHEAPIKNPALLRGFYRITINYY